MEERGTKRKKEEATEEKEDQKTEQSPVKTKKAKAEAAGQQATTGPQIVIEKEELPFADHADYFEAPREYHVASPSSDKTRISIFLGGGISNCPNWQKIVSG